MILALLVNFTFGQETKDKKGVTFAVSDVKPATALYPEIGYKDAVQQRVNAVIEGYPLSEADRKLIPVDVHGFVAALHIAFAQHRPMVISPDMIWLMIVQGATMHIQQNKEVLRDKIVAFQGKRSLNIIENSFRKGSLKNDWSNAFAQFSDSIKKQVSDSVYGLFVTSFSTTTPKEKSAFEIALMDGVDDYFDYEMETFCGIPQITLEGTTEDWRWIEKNLIRLESIGMTDWCNALKPIINEFVKASEGKIDRMFWQSIYKWNNESGGPTITGWILKFFPYIILDHKLLPNRFMKDELYAYGGLRTNNFPSGLSKADVVWTYFGEKIDMEFYAGFMGVSQNSGTKGLRPEIGWAVRNDSSEIIKRDFMIVTDSRNEVDSVGNKVVVRDGIVEKSNLLDLPLNNEGFKNQIDFHFMDYESVIHYYKTDKKGYFSAPIIFPQKSKLIEENEIALNRYVKEKFKDEKLEFCGEVSFVITWTGNVDNVKITKSDHPELNELVRSIIDQIKDCKPGMLKGRFVNAEIVLKLKVN